LISLCRCRLKKKNARIQPVKRSWEIIADKLKQSGLEFGLRLSD
jgi:hypothetical protein